MEKGFVTIVMIEEPNYPFKLTHHIGTIIPAYSSAIGKAFLSELTEAELDNFYPEEELEPRTSRTITTKAELKLELKKIKKAGISFNREGAYEGIVGIGSVVRGKKGKAIASLSISIPVFRITQANQQKYATLVKLGASLISYRLGYEDKTQQIHNIEEIRSWWEENQAGLAVKT
ncbi:IclR family transcriptional regulator [Chloroflexota bacterium]